jgi:hypothetical protein
MSGLLFGPGKSHNSLTSEARVGGDGAVVHGRQQQRFSQHEPPMPTHIVVPHAVYLPLLSENRVLE